MVADHLPTPYQEPHDSATPSPAVLIVEDVEQAARELRAFHKANHRAILFHLREASAAWAKYRLIMGMI